MADNQEAIDAIRESIKTTVVSNAKDDDGQPIEQKEVEVKEPDNDAEVEVKKEEKEEKVIEAEADDETEVEVESIEKLKKTIEKLQKKVGKTIAEKKQITKDLELAKAKLVDEGKENVLTEEDVERRAEEKAIRKTTELKFLNACNRLFDEAVKIDKTFKLKVDNMAEDIGAIPGVMIEVLEGLDNGGAILNYLTDNTDEAEVIFDLIPTKMAIELSKISTKIKPKLKTVSKVPDPPSKTLSGKGGASDTSRPPPDPTKNMDAYIEWRQKDIANKRAAGKYNLR